MINRYDVPKREKLIPIAPFVLTIVTARRDKTSSSGAERRKEQSRFENYAKELRNTHSDRLIAILK